MKEICFEQKREALSFSEYMLDIDQFVRLNIHRENGYGVYVHTKEETKEWRDILTNGLIHVFTLHRERTWLHEILRYCYYYENDEEIAHIMELCRCFLEEHSEKTMVPRHVLSHGQQTDWLSKIFGHALDEGSTLFFESVVRFRMSDYYNELIEFVGYAIDEYKREEEYQTHIQYLRDYMQTKQSKMNHLLIIQKADDFQFFNERGEWLTRAMLKQVVKQEPLYLCGVDDKEWDITPIIALAPERISLYSNHVEHPKVLTVLSVFQEKVSMKPLKKFPFSHLLSLEL
ncbi:sporulation protein YtxC [Pontibacillus litoralis]|uniref:Sporulation protein YtxC n=1 Tax=Pontibacillus litoralis JSM 072002 TaxID=1385512 RepID=A0A0A5GDL0_9BACI|nr:sporulation protein YtxC [Pontibacillus litoralis]KGX89210.1 hypothetical protein N784_01750 [Pontibacillus litoralis JSM 072002]